MWRGRAELTLRCARGAYVVRNAATKIAGALATAAMETALAVLAARGEWVTNENRLLRRAGLREIDTIVAGLRRIPAFSPKRWTRRTRARGKAHVATGSGWS